MKFSNFEVPYSRVIKIIDICSQLPSQLQDETYKFLLKALIKDTGQGIHCGNSFQEFLEGSDIKNYIDQKKLASNIERSLLFVFYLEKQFPTYSYRYDTNLL